VKYIYFSAGGGISRLTLELVSFSLSNFTLVGHSIGGPITANWLRDNVIMKGGVYDPPDPSFTITVEREITENYLESNPFKSVLFMKGYNPGVFTYRVLNRSLSRSKSITIEGIVTKFTKRCSCLTA
jgi:pimeloyl-ACP methyl ester carboxylesterase